MTRPDHRAAMTFCVETSVSKFATYDERSPSVEAEFTTEPKR